MKKLLRILQFSKRQKFVLAVIFLSASLFVSEFYAGNINGLFIGVGLSVLTVIVLYLILRKDVKGSFYYPILILPFFYTLSCNLFYSLIPPRLFTKVLMTAIYAFGLYSMFLSHNIFAVSAIRTINLLRSARVVSFIITLLVAFFLIDVIFTLHYFLPVTMGATFIVFFILNFQSLWSYSLERTQLKEITLYSLFNALVLTELGIVLLLWPVNATIYSIFLIGMFYAYSGLLHAWFEKRLFKGLLWEYVWVAFLAIVLLLVFSQWGIY